MSHQRDFFSHAEWIALKINRWETAGYAWPGDIRELEAHPFTIDSLDAPSWIAAGGMECHASTHLYWQHFGYALVATR